MNDQEYEIFRHYQQLVSDVMHVLGITNGDDEAILARLRGVIMERDGAMNALKIANEHRLALLRPRADSSGTIPAVADPFVQSLFKPFEPDVSLGAVPPAAEGGRPGGDGSGGRAAPRRDMPDEGVQR
jgi:hypothetical protein